MRAVLVVLRVCVVLVMASTGVAATGCMSPVIPFGGNGKSSKELQHDTMDKFTPAQLVATTRWSGAGPVRVAKLRVWADDEYRAQNLRWQQGFDDQLEYANQVFTPMLGVRLEAEYRVWDHHAPGNTLSDHLKDLVAADSGDDVVWVVGLTSALSLVSATFEQLGLAELDGRHLMVRGYTDIEERKSFERAFPDVRDVDRDIVLEARRHHKTTAVLLHEMAHCLGALHETAPDFVMSPSYSHRAASIDDHNRDLMLIVLDDRLKPASARDPRAEARAMLAALEPGWSGWAAADRAALIEQLHGEAGPSVAVAVTSGPIPATVEDDYQHAEQLFARGDLRGASATLEPLVAAYPAHAELRVLVCQIELARGGAKDAKAIAACDRAVQLAGSVAPLVAVAQARLTAGDAAGARATLAICESRIASLPPDHVASGWLALADQYRAMGAVTWAEAALASSGAGPDADRGIARWVATTRARYGIPHDAARWKLAPDDEPLALAAVKHLLDLVNASKFDAAAKAASAAEQRWPNLPGLLAERCELEMRRGAVGAARRQCERAIAQGASSWALYLDGVIELQTDTPAATAAGIARLRAAIELDPDLGQAWRTLRKALIRANATAELDKLRHAYAIRFGEPM